MTNPHIGEGFFETANGSKYLQQLCKHWSHNLAVEYQDGRATIVFPKDARGADWPGDAVVELTAIEGGIGCRINASAVGQLEGLKGAVSGHLDRFAFREAPLPVEWKA